MDNILDQSRLKDLGMRVEGDFILNSGKKTNVKWIIEEFMKHPDGIRVKAIIPWLEAIKQYSPKSLIGVPTGGTDLAIVANKSQQLMNTSFKYPEDILEQGEIPAILIDDVLTTGGTVRRILKDRVKKWGEIYYSDIIAVAVLVNRSDMTEICGLPIISGIFADKVM